MSQNYKAPRLTLPVGARDHSEGSADPRVVLLEYGDYQCPYCGAAYPVVKKIQKELGPKLQFVFRNFPLTNEHPYAMWAAETAEAVGAQGKFWEMHDFLYENQQQLGDETFFANYEKKLKLDAAKINRDVSQHAYSTRVEEDYRSGIRSGVNGTPTFYINSVRYDGDADYGPLLSALEKAQKRS